MQRRLIVFLFLAVCMTSAAAPAGEAGPVLLYSRYYNADGEQRYHADGTYADILRHLGREFVVRSHREPLTSETLAGVAVVVIANPNDRAVGTNPPPPHCSPADRAALLRHVQDGGGLIIMGNQENHNLETAAMNVLLAAFGMRLVDIYTDAKRIVVPATTPRIGGLTWAYYTGNHIELEIDHPAKPQALVTNDPTQPALGGPRNPASVLMATATLGLGRVALITDAGWLTNDALSGKGIGKVAITEHDNAEIFQRLCRWCAGR